MPRARPFKPIDDVEEFRRRVQIGVTEESEQLEFKRELQKAATKEKRAEIGRETARDIAQFANAWGGSLVFGVSEKQEGGRKVAFALHGIADVEALRRSIGQSIANHLVPSTLRVTYATIEPEPGKLVVIVNVAPSIIPVAVWDRERSIEYIYRRDQSKAYLNPDEATSMIHSQRSRAAKLALMECLPLCKQASDGVVAVELASHVWWPVQTNSAGTQWEPAAADVFLKRAAENMRFDELDVELIVRSGDKNHPVRVPYGLLREVWVTSETRLGLLLDLRILLWRGRAVLGPAT